MSWSVVLPDGLRLAPSEADSDMSVFKVLEITHHKNLWSSLEYGRLYEKGKTAVLEDSIQIESVPFEPGFSKWEAKNGFSSYAPGELKLVKAEATDKFPNDLKMFHHGIKEYSFDEQGIMRYVAMECVIPKGATYYYDSRHKEYLSDRLLITGVVVPLWRFRV